MTERENFYKWIESCPLTNYRICGATATSVNYEFQFNVPEPYLVSITSFIIDEQADDLLNHLKK